MARIFISEDEAHNWLPVKKKFDYDTFKQKVIIRVVSGIIILMVTCVLAYFQYATVRASHVPNTPQFQKVSSCT